MRPLFDLILREVPPPAGDPAPPLQFQATILDYDDYVGRIAIGRIVRGELRAAQTVGLCKRDGTVEPAKVGKLWIFEGLRRREVESASAGEIAAICGIAGINIGETVSDAENPLPLPLLAVDEPTLTMTFMVNDSPFAGREGKYVTSRHLRDRLWKEAETNVGLRVAETGSPDAFQVSGRGELHLGILIETMRREGYELQVSKPEPILKRIDGEIYEPYERLMVSVPEAFSGAVIENLGRRRAEMLDMRPVGQGQIKMEFSIPARGSDRLPFGVPDRDQGRGRHAPPLRRVRAVEGRRSPGGGGGCWWPSRRGRRRLTPSTASRSAGLFSSSPWRRSTPA